MVEVKNLMIGNLIFNQHERMIKVDFQHLEAINFGRGIYNYIPISESILLELGFNKDYKKGYIGIDVNSSDFVLIEPLVMGEWQTKYAFEFNAGGWSKFVEFEFVNELQNFFNSLTKKQLQPVSTK